MARVGTKLITPLLNRVLVRRVIPRTKTASGIILPESALPKLNKGVVMAVGVGFTTPEGTKMPIQCKVGDTVLLPPYGGSEIKLGSNDTTGEEHILYRDDEIMAIIEDE